MGGGQICIMHSLPTASGVQMPSKCYLDITQKPNVICKENFAQMLIGLSSLVGQHPMKSLLSIFLLLVGQCPMKSLLSICLSLQLSLYLKIGSLLFSDIVLDQGFPQVLRTWGGCVPHLGWALQN